MITKARITQTASTQKVAAKTVERDYVLAHAVAAIASHDKAGRLVFKGGTALRLCHFPDYRYSADLDYSVVGAPEGADPGRVRVSWTRSDSGRSGLPSTIREPDWTGESAACCIHVANDVA